MSNERSRRSAEEHRRPRQSCVERCSATLDLQECKSGPRKGGRTLLFKAIAALVEILGLRPQEPHRVIPICVCNSSSKGNPGLSSGLLEWPELISAHTTSTHAHMHTLAKHYKPSYMVLLYKTSTKTKSREMESRLVFDWGFRIRMNWGSIKWHKVPT